MTDPYAVVDDGEEDNMFSELSSDLARLDSEAEAILNSIRNEAASETSRQSRSDTSSPVIPDDSDSESIRQDDGDMHDDDEMNDEILRLGSIVASLQQDLDTMSVTTVTSTVSTLDSPSASRPSPENHYARFNRQQVLQFIHSKKLYGPGVGGQATNVPLVVLNVLVWTIVFALVVHVKQGALNEQGGGLTFLPTFGQ